MIDKIKRPESRPITDALVTADAETTTEAARTLEPNRITPTKHTESTVTPRPATEINDSTVKKAAETSKITPADKLAATHDMTIERPSEKLSKQIVTERAAKSSNPLEMPYDDVSRDSEEYKDWRREQHRHGMRNLLLAIVVFGSLAVLYWIFIHNA